MKIKKENKNKKIENIINYIKQFWYIFSKKELEWKFWIDLR